MKHQGGRHLWVAVAASLVLSTGGANAGEYVPAGLGPSKSSTADSLRYAYKWTPPRQGTTSIHLDAGVFSPVDVNAPSPTVGLRLSKLFGSHLQVGVLTGWTFERKDLTESTSDSSGSTSAALLARTDAHLVPLMGYMRVNLTERHWLVPYVGAATGYEWLTLEATDYRTAPSTTSTATYSSWAWQGWLGLGLRLGQAVRLNGEVYYNGATLERDVVDVSGKAWKELVNLDGVGLRVGLDIVSR